MESGLSSFGNTFVSKDGDVDDSSLKSVKLVGIYFSAHWCPPCRGFTPVLAEFYNKINANGKVLEIVFVTGDRDEKSFKDYLASMPWIALPFDSPNIQSLKANYAIRGIPNLVIIKTDGTTVSTNGRDDVSNLGEQALKTWESS